METVVLWGQDPQCPQWEPGTACLSGAVTSVGSGLTSGWKAFISSLNFPTCIQAFKILGVIIKCYGKSQGSI